MNAHTISVTSKLPSRRSGNEFYRYYAGYPLEFAEWALGELGLTDGAIVFDPWNGSGTTSAACARRGLACNGYDISPVMVHLGRARVASCNKISEANDLIDQTEEILKNHSVVTVQRLARAFNELPVGDETAHSAAIASLFPVSKELYPVAKSKNPAWYSLHDEPKAKRMGRRKLFDLWRQYLEQLKSWTSAPDEGSGGALTVERADSRKSIGRAGAYDGLLTSPPYLTRLDYVHATLPELLLLSDFDRIPDLQRLRRSMLGSPLTSSRPQHSLDRLPERLTSTLERISGHNSKASSTYYFRFFSTYFVDLQASIRNIARALRDGATGCMVVQSSHYKEIEIDLAAAIVEIGAEVGLVHIKSVEFSSKRSMALVNSKAHSDARQPKSESAVFFRRG